MLDADPGGGFEPANTRHPKIHEHHVGSVLRDAVYRLRAVGRLGNHVDPRQVLEHRSHAGAEDGMVIGDQHSRHSGHLHRQDRTNCRATARRRADVEPATHLGGPVADAAQPDAGDGSARHADAVVANDHGDLASGLPG